MEQNSDQIEEPDPSENLHLNVESYEKMLGFPLRLLKDYDPQGIALEQVRLDMTAIARVRAMNSEVVFFLPFVNGGGELRIGAFVSKHDTAQANQVIGGIAVFGLNQDHIHLNR